MSVKCIKNLSLALGLSLSSFSLLAAIPGYYAGLELGQGYESIDNGSAVINATTVTLTKHKKKGFSGRAFVGYNVNQVYGMELGLTQFSKARWTTRSGSSTLSNTTLGTTALDLMSQFHWRFASRYNISGGLGLSIVRGVYGGDVSQLKGTEYYIRPAVAIGAGIKVTQKTTIVANYLHIFGRSSSGNALQNANPSGYLPDLSLASLGFSVDF